MHIKNYKDFINEKQNHSYGCVMAYFNIANWGKITNLIDIDDLYIEDGDVSYGYSKNPHVTLLYGLHNDIDHSKVISMVKAFPNVAVELKTLSLFENDEYDVLKFDIENDLLANLNEQLKAFPYTSNFPIFHAHMTVGYCKKGTGKKYLNMIKPIQLASHYYIYSLSSGEKIKI